MIPYNIGDQFICLVNFKRRLQYGEILTIESIAPSDRVFMFSCRTSNSGMLWGFTRKSIEFATIPIRNLTEKELFVYKLAGIPPIPEKILTDPEKHLVYHGY